MWSSTVNLINYIPGGSYLVGKNPNENKPTLIPTNTRISTDEENLANLANEFIPLSNDKLTTELKVEDEDEDKDAKEQKIENLETKSQALSDEKDRTIVDAQTTQITEIETLETQAKQQDKDKEIEKLRELLLLATTEANKAKKDLATVTKENETLKNEKQTLETSVQNAKKSFQTQSAKIKTLEEQENQTNKAALRLEAEKKEAQEKIENLEIENKTLSGLQESLNKKADEDTITVNAQTTKITELERQAQQQKVKIEELDRLLLDATTKASEAGTNLKKAEEEKSGLETNLAEQKQESNKLVAKLEAEKKEAQEKIEKLEIQNQALSELQENLNKKAEADTTTVNAQTAQITKLETQAKQQDEKIKELKELLFTATTQVHEAGTKLERMEQEKSELETNRANQKRESAKLEAENREAQEKIEKLSNSDKTQMGIIETIGKKHDEKDKKVTEIQIKLKALQNKIDNMELEKAQLDGANQGLQEMLNERNEKILVLENLKAEYQAALSGNGKIAKQWGEIDSAYAEIQEIQNNLGKSKTTLEEKEKEKQRNIFEAKPKTSAAITSSAAAASVGVTLCFVVPLIIKALAITGAAALAVTIGLPVLCGVIGAALIGLATYGIYKLATKPKESTVFHNPQPSKEKGPLLMCEQPPAGIYGPQMMSDN